MKIRNLDTFYWIVSLGSFRAAAEKLPNSEITAKDRMRSVSSMRLETAVISIFQFF